MLGERRNSGSGDASRRSRLPGEARKPADGRAGAPRIDASLTSITDASQGSLGGDSPWDLVSPSADPMAALHAHQKGSEQMRHKWGHRRTATAGRGRSSLTAGHDMNDLAASASATSTAAFPPVTGGTEVTQIAAASSNVAHHHARHAGQSIPATVMLSGPASGAEKGISSSSSSRIGGLSPLQEIAEEGETNDSESGPIVPFSGSTVHSANGPGPDPNRHTMAPPSLPGAPLRTALSVGRLPSLARARQQLGDEEYDNDEMYGDGEDENEDENSRLPVGGDGMGERKVNVSTASSDSKRAKAATGASTGGSH